MNDLLDNKDYSVERLANYNLALQKNVLVNTLFDFLLSNFAMEFKMTIKNIIFDLGGVILNINYQNTITAFHTLGAFNFGSIYTQHSQSTFFDEFDTGKISDAGFRDKLREILDIPLTDHEIDNAWNAMLLDLPTNRLEFIKSLKLNYKVFLFSNTNSIHLKEVYNILNKKNSLGNFDQYFDRQYFSHICGYRKPHPESFLKILNENNLNAEETLFIDDSAQHIEGARKAGIHTFHFTSEKNLPDLLNVIRMINDQNETKSNEDKMIINLSMATGRR